MLEMEHQTVLAVTKLARALTGTSLAHTKTRAGRWKELPQQDNAKAQSCKHLSTPAA